ncbi:MAG: methyl-accepting chemotaxis protein [Acidobacteriota bacterium]
MSKLLIVGGGKGGTSILCAFVDLEGIEVAGICDVNLNAPGLKTAREIGVPVFTDLKSALRINNLEIVIEATGNESVRNAILEAMNPETILVDSSLAKVLMILVDSRRDVMVTKLKSEAEKLADTAEVLRTTVAHVRSAAQEVTSEAGTIAANNIELMKTTEKASKFLDETGEMLDLITSVAKETQLLGLNAAIEGARAGEHGRGFTIVAEEVRKLAEHSAASAKRIAPILLNIEAAIQMIVRDVQTTSEASQRQAATTEEIFANIQEMENLALSLADEAKTLVAQV